MGVLRFNDFFAGAGLATLGLSPQWTCVWANDIDPKKAEVYRSNFGGDHFFLDDVAKFRAADLPNSTQLSWASFPCQDLSLAGWRRGLSADRSGAFWAFWRIMREQFRNGARPPIIVIENVVGLLHHTEGFIGLAEALAALGMQFGAMVIDARRFLPQSRPRVFVVAVDARLDCGKLISREPVKEWTPQSLQRAVAALPSDLRQYWRWWNLSVPSEPPHPLTRIIERNPTGVEWHTRKETLYLLSLMNKKNRQKVYDAQKGGRRKIGFVYKRMREGLQRAEVRFDGIAGCLRTPRGGSSRQTVIVVEDGNVRSRLLSPREAARLMGVSDNYKLPDGYNHGYKAMGDAVAVPVVRWLSEHLLTPLAKRSARLPEGNGHNSHVNVLLERSEVRASGWTLEVKRKQMKEIESKCLQAVKEWFEGESQHLEGGSDKYVVCAGIAIAQVLKDKSPIAEKDYITDGNQVKTSGGLIRKVLKQFGEERKYVSEGGRTTRGTRPAAERLVRALNGISELTAASKEGRTAISASIQSWLVENGVKPFFNKQKIEVDISLDKPGTQIVADVLEAATKRNNAGAVAQHLVGAKLALRYPLRQIENHSFTTADKQLGRPGDFLVGDTAFHVTVAPAQDVIGKCGANIKNGYRAMLLVTESRIQAARQLAEIAGLQQRVGIISLEQFVGQNIEEIGEFGKVALAKNIRALFEKYNERVLAVETDRSLLVEVPTNI